MQICSDFDARYGGGAYLYYFELVPRFTRTWRHDNSHKW